jgi:hypothetical protein
MHAESLVRAESQPQQPTINHSNESMMMMDLTRDGLFISYLLSYLVVLYFFMHQFLF